MHTKRTDSEADESTPIGYLEHRDDQPLCTATRVLKFKTCPSSLKSCDVLSLAGLSVQVGSV